jgi:hypothetical protein
LYRIEVFADLFSAFCGNCGTAGNRQAQSGRDGSACEVPRFWRIDGVIWEKGQAESVHGQRIITSSHLISIGSVAIVCR